MRIWSAFDLIPKALAFEKAESVDESDARDWTRRSLMRVPLALLTSLATLAAFGAACGSPCRYRNPPTVLGAAEGPKPSKGENA